MTMELLVRPESNVPSFRHAYVNGPVPEAIVWNATTSPTQADCEPIGVAVVGGRLKITANEKRAEMPPASVAGQMTRCLPAAKIDPGGGTHGALTPPQLSLAIAPQTNN